MREPVRNVRAVVAVRAAQDLLGKTNQRLITEAVAALSAGDMKRMGEIMVEAQVPARRTAAARTAAGAAHSPNPQRGAAASVRPGLMRARAALSSSAVTAVPRARVRGAPCAAGVIRQVRDAHLPVAAHVAQPAQGARAARAPQ